MRAAAAVVFSSLVVPHAPLPAPRTSAPAYAAQQSAALAKALERGDWSAPVLADAASAVRIAQQAQREGKISAAQLATVALRWEVASDWKPSEAELAPLPVLTPSGELTDGIRSILGHSSPWMMSKDYRAGLDAAELSRFQEAVKKLPESEKGVWIVPISNERLKGGSSEEPWASGHETLQTILFRELFRPPDAGPGRTSMILPSFGVFQAILDAKFGADAVQLLPRFGPIGVSKLMNEIRAGGRVFGLHHPDIAMETTADLEEVGRVGFTKHDFYHAFIGSTHTRNWRKIYYEIYRLGRVYRARLKRGGEPELAQGRPVRLEGGWPNIAQKLGDLTTSNYGRRAPSSLADLLAIDFNSQASFLTGNDAWDGTYTYYEGSAGLWALILKDMARRPKTWARLGVDVGAEVLKLSDPMKAVYWDFASRNPTPGY